MVDKGIIRALCLQLGFVLRRRGSVKEEVYDICTAISVFYRFCPGLVSSEDSLRRGTDLFFLLPEAFQKGAVLSVMSIWHSIASTEGGTRTLLQNPNALLGARDVVKNQLGGTDGVLEALGFLKNVTYFCEENRKLVISQRGLLSALTRLPFNDTSEKVRDKVSSVYRNMALSLHTRVALAKRPDFLTALTALANSTSASTVKNMLSTIVSLASDPDSSLLIVFHGEGILVEILRRCISNEEDVTVRKRAVRAIRLLATETSAPLMIHDNTLMDALSKRALHDQSAEVRSEAAEAFAKCASLVTAPMAQHEAVLDALTHLSSSPHAIPSDVMARALREQANHPENRKALAKREALMVVMGQIAMSDKTSVGAKENICSVWLQLSFEDHSIRELIATPLTLEALVHNATSHGNRNHTIRQDAIKALLNLAAVPSNRERMVKHASLMRTLLHYASTTRQEDLKTEVKAAIMHLAQEL
ncbi:unnamed protein product [Cylindrotheca closterium]|uniref:Uncharacterized protein n=1 Tax=Cylindrotheca closterium TaxID=2856 RepID=A0AAD2JNG6_9STRA|nr:unnamed protein product [Cylindrotheca closterium]